VFQKLLRAPFATQKQAPKYEFSGEIGPLKIGGFSEMLIDLQTANTSFP
jgi:hypothetical protein